MTTISKNASTETTGATVAPKKAKKTRAKKAAAPKKNQRAEEKAAREKKEAARKAKAEQRKAAAEAKAKEKEEAKAKAEADRIQAAASSDFATYKPPVFKTVPLANISWPSEKTGRLTRPLTKDDKFEEKVLYILANGRTMTPLGVRKVKAGSYEGFDGQHRYFAYLEANERLTAAGKDPITEVPVAIWDISVNESLQLGLMANNSSRLMTKLEQSMAIAAYLARKENQGITMSDAARAFGMKLGTFRNVASLAKLTPEFSAAVFKDKTVPASIAYVVGRLPEEEQNDWLEVAQEKGQIHDTIKAVQDRVAAVKDGASVGGTSSRKAVEQASTGTKSMTKAQIEEHLSDLLVGDSKVIGKISLVAQSVAIDTLRMVLGLTESNTAHWAVGFQGSTQAVERDDDGNVVG